MRMDSNSRPSNTISSLIIGRSFAVLNTLGPGFLEKVYENALAHELRKSGLDVSQQHDVSVHYDGVLVGLYKADMLVEDTVVIEVKAVRALDANHVAQCVNYLKATRLSLCLLLNFGNPRLEIRRLVNGL